MEAGTSLLYPPKMRPIERSQAIDVTKAAGRLFFWFFFFGASKENEQIDKRKIYSFKSKKII
jgi:hypothetical protein